MSDTPRELNLDEAKTIAEVLLGAAYADEKLVGSESKAIRKILRNLLEVGQLPDALEQHIAAFAIARFDLEACCQRLHLAHREDRRNLLALINKVSEADHILDLDEDAYLKRVARCIGAAADEFADLSLDVIQISSLSEPPPLPRSPA